MQMQDTVNSNTYDLLSTDSASVLDGLQIASLDC